MVRFALLSCLSVSVCWAGGVNADAPAQPLTVESAAARAALPLYKVIPAAKDSELTPAAADTESHRSWMRSHADAGGTRYSALDQIRRDNVAKLQVAWTFSSGDGLADVAANPVIANGVMYAPTTGKHIAAVNAATGVELWRFKPETSGYWGPAYRGLLYWPGKSGSNQATVGPRLFFASGTWVYALDPKTGKPIETFGDRGRVPSTGGDDGPPVAPAVFEDILVAPKANVVDAFNVVTGARVWDFNLNAESSKFKYNCWAGMVLDAKRGIAFFQVGDPHLLIPELTNREERNLYSNSIVALDARNGRLLWYFQDITHNIWDLDIASPPNLVTVTRNGKKVDAVAQLTKQGNTLLLDRTTGKPLFPYRMRRAPTSTIPGERTWPYQPDLELPQPFSRQEFTLADITQRTPKANAFVREQASQADFGWFQPFRDGRPLILFGIEGGAEWTGASFDPTTGWLFVNANEIPWILTLKSGHKAAVRDPNSPPTAGEKVFLSHCAACHGQQREGKGTAPSLVNLKERVHEQYFPDIVRNGQGGMPPQVLSGEEFTAVADFLYERDLPPVMDGVKASEQQGGEFSLTRFSRLIDDEGYPASTPPWGTLNAIDLNTGKIVWKVPLGEYEELTRKGIPKTGTENYAGTIVTAGGLVFAAGARDSKIRAFDKSNGKELWEHKLPFMGLATPATYEVDGRQYVVIAATGGGKLSGPRGDTYVAFALPKVKP